MIKKIFGDIRFWIIIFFIFRLIGITNPPLEVGHNWRQTTVTMVARNYLEVDNNLFYPRVDFAGNKTGITGMEFPLLNYLIYLVAELFGYEHWYGRLINLLISSVGLFYFYKLIRKYFNERVAFFSTIILAVSVWFHFSRKIMPDTFSMSLVIAGIYYGTNYLDSSNRRFELRYLIGYGFLMALGVLSKIPSGFLLIIFAFFLFDHSIQLKRKLIFSTITLIAILPAVFWYYYWVPHLVERFGFWHFFMGKDMSQGYVEILQHLNKTLSRFYDTALKFIGFAAFVYGLVYSILKKDPKVYSLFVLSFLGFSVIIFKAGFTFTHHNYYVIPFVPIMALVAGYGLSKLKYSKLAFVILIAISIEGIGNQVHDFSIKEKSRRILNLENDLDQISRRDELILINSGDFPTPMYFAHRKGWISSNDRIKDKEYVAALEGNGLKYIVILKRAFGSEISLMGYEKVLENEDYCIYKL